MGDFFKNANNFVVHNSYNNTAPGMNITVESVRSDALLPPNRRPRMHIQTQINRISSAPIVSSGPPAEIESPPSIATSHSMPEVPMSAQLETPPVRTPIGRSSVKAEPMEDRPTTPMSPSGPSRMPSPPPSPLSSPRVQSAQPRKEPPVPSNTSRSKPPSESLPRPDPIPSHAEPTPIDVELMNGVAPTFKHGIIAAFSAQAHLLQRTKPIGDLLDRHGIRSDGWIGQVGFRLDKSSDRRSGEVPSILRQEIVITISDRGAAKARLSEISEGLKALVTPYYGAIKFQNSKEVVDLRSQAQEGPETSTHGNIFVRECSRAHESAFEVDLPDPLEAEKPPKVKLNVTNFGNDGNPLNHFTTALEFALEKDEKSRQGSNPSKIDFSQLRFEGPVPYSMRGAHVRVTLDQPCGFEDVMPEEQSEVDPTSQYKHNAQKTKKKMKIQEAQLKLGKNTEGTLKAGRMDGEENMVGVETMRNSWLIRHSDEKQSNTLRYIPARQELDRQMSFPKAFRPSMKFTPNSKRSPPSTITVRIWSFWALESQDDKDKGGFFQKLWVGLRGQGSSLGEKDDPRMHTNVIHCVEVVVPLAFVGRVTEFATREDILEELVRT